MTVNVTDAGLYEKDDLHEITWVLAVSINAILTALSLWILFSLVHYGIKTGQWDGKKKRNADKLNAGPIYTSVIACIVMVIIRFVTSQIAHNVGHGPEQMDVCENVNDALFVEYSLVLFCTYIFLWLRQRTFYTNKMFNIGYSKALKILSGSSIFILAVAGIGVNLVNTVTDNYPSSVLGCYYDSESDSLDNWSWAVCAVTLVVGQILLLSLLIYPLTKNLDEDNCFRKLCCCFQTETSTLRSPTKRKMKRDSNISELSKTTNSSYSTNRRSKTVKKIMSRTVLFGCIAVFTDILLIAVISTSILNQENPRLRKVSTTLYDISAFLNLTLVVMSFMTWKKMLTSPFRKWKIETGSFRTTSTTSF